MNAIVINTLTGSVTEHRIFPQSMTGSFMGSVNGLHAFGGDDDDGMPIVSHIKTGARHCGDARKKIMDAVYFSMKGDGQKTMTVYTHDAAYPYQFQVRAAQVSRAIPGRGIRSNYAAFGFSSSDGSAFRIDRIEVKFNTSQRRL